MPDIPEDMNAKERGPDPDFRPDEQLYRRVPHELWDDDEVDLMAIDLPDMSVNRGKYGPPEWVRLFSDETLGWGVVGFRVGDIPPTLQDVGAFLYRFRAVHVPHARNYPHPEVRAFEAPADRHGEETHITVRLESLLSKTLLMRWREQLRRKCRIILRAGRERRPGIGHATLRSIPAIGPALPGPMAGMDRRGCNQILWW